MRALMEQEQTAPTPLWKVALGGLAAVIFVPLIGIIYSFPVALICREKQPWCSLLAGCLFLTAWSIGSLTGISPEKIRLAWYWSLAAYVLCLIVMGVSNIIESFAAAHTLCILITVGIGPLADIARTAALKEKARAEKAKPDVSIVLPLIPCPAA